MNVTRTREAFDRHARAYDEQFSSSATTKAVRQRIWNIADPLFPSSARLLDLGSGTGDDAIHFAQRGLHVTSIDLAPRMVARLIAKADAAGVSNRINVHIGDFKRFDGENGSYDGLFSNFGALNCVDDLTPLGKLASDALKPGALVVLVTMGRWYPAETLLFLMKGDVRRAFRRFRKTTQVNVEGVDVPVWYHSVRDLRRALGPKFYLQSTLGLKAVDRALARLPSMGVFSDHYVTVWRYR